MGSNNKTLARKSYEKHRAEMRAASLERLRAMVGQAPLTVELQANRSSRNEMTLFVVGAPNGHMVVGRYENAAAFIDGYVRGWKERLEAAAAVAAYTAHAEAFASENPKLYDVARDACHEQGLPWTDPRDGVTYPPPDPLDSPEGAQFAEDHLGVIAADRCVCYEPDSHSGSGQLGRFCPHCGRDLRKEEH